MWIEHVEGVWAQYDDIFQGFVAVGVYTLFSAADQIFSEMAVNEWNGMLEGQDLV